MLYEKRKAIHYLVIFCRGRGGSFFPKTLLVVLIRITYV